MRNIKGKIKYFDRIINENPEISIRKISIITRLKELYAERETYFRNKFLMIIQR